MVPFGAVSAANWSAMIARRHFHEYGTTREQLGALAVSQRANAALNPKAVFREPITLRHYLDARMISDPLCLLDCDVPVDGSTAVIVSRADAEPDLRSPLLRIAAHSSALNGRPYWDQHEDLTSMAGTDAGRNLWRHTDLTVGEVDVAGIYDGFTILTVVWLEALGVCGKGEAGPFLEGASGSRGTASSRSTPGASCPRGGCTASATCTRCACSCAARPGNGRCPAGRRLASSPPGAASWAGPCY
jgi:acetyl-CoA acetyltransferase